MDKLACRARAALKRQWWVGLNGYEVAFVLSAKRWIEAREGSPDRKTQTKVGLARVAVCVIKNHHGILQRSLSIEEIVE